MSSSAARSRRLRNVIAFALLLLPVLAVPALAHGGVVQAVPGPGQTTGGTVDTLQLLFAEPVNDAAVTFERGGEELPVGDPGQPVSNLLEVPVDPLTEEGQYIVRYAVTFDDGVDFDSGYQFTYDPDAPGPLPIVATDVALGRGPSVPGLLIGALSAVIALLAARFAFGWYRLREAGRPLAAQAAEQKTG